MSEAVGRDELAEICSLVLDVASLSVVPNGEDAYCLDFEQLDVLREVFGELADLGCLGEVADELAAFARFLGRSLGMEDACQQLLATAAEAMRSACNTQSLELVDRARAFSRLCGGPPRMAAPSVEQRSGGLTVGALIAGLGQRKI